MKMPAQNPPERAALGPRVVSSANNSFRQLMDNRPAFISLIFIVVLACGALMATWLANNKPLAAVYRNQLLFPAITCADQYIFTTGRGDTLEVLPVETTDWKRLPLGFAIWAPVAYAPGRTDRDNHYLNANYVAPAGEQKFYLAGREVELPAFFRHWLGTMKKGEDMLAGLIHGSRISLLIGLLSMGIASVIGLLLGAVAGYFGDNRLRISLGTMLMYAAGLLPAFYYGFMLRKYQLADALQRSAWEFALQMLLSLLFFCLTMAVFHLLGKALSSLPPFAGKKPVPLDSIVMRCIEVLLSVPRLVLIIVLAALVSRASILNVICIIGLTSWTGIARLVRAEFFRLRDLEYMDAARALGYSHRRIIFRHALPNAIAPAVVAITFGVASAILIESGLSFLGIGVPQDVVTWGGMLNACRENFSAWWLALFPGLAIFLTVTACNLLGEGLRDALDPRTE